MTDVDSDSRDTLDGEGIEAPSVPRRRKRWQRSAFEWLVVLFAALLIAFCLRTFAFQVFFVPSTSMVPTLQVGDRIVVDKFLFNYHSLHRGDIVVFTRPPADTECGVDETDLVKRVIGLPGQTISSRGNTVYINGKPLKEPYLPSDDPLGPKAITTQVVAKDHYFVMGDNRSISCDSRYWGQIAGSSVVGRVIAIIWHNGHPDLHTF